MQILWRRERCVCLRASSRPVIVFPCPCVHEKSPSITPHLRRISWTLPRRKRERDDQIVDSFSHLHGAWFQSNTLSSNISAAPFESKKEKGKKKPTAAACSSLHCCLLFLIKSSDFVHVSKCCQYGRPHFVCALLRAGDSLCPRDHFKKPTDTRRASDG